jgi:ABC-type glycerol-3-phosphate transport system substrate-binding protein
MRPFEIGLIVTFILAALIGVAVLSTRKNDTDSAQSLIGTSFSIWGTLDERPIQEFLRDLGREDQAFQAVTYRRINPRSFESELVNAIAEGNSPELILVPHTFLVSLRTKLQPLSFTSFPERTFRDTYIDGAGIFMLSDGVYGYPFAVDPLVLYWNRDLFSSSGLAQPPRTWEALIADAVPALTKRDSQFELAQSAVALGEYSNITRAKEVLATLFFQAGSMIVDEADASYRVTLNQGGMNGVLPGESVLTFYTQFSNPAKAVYSWNRAKTEDRRSFLQGTLAMYFGLGSERTALERENANLNFDMTEIPQGSGATVRRGYGEFYAFAVPRGSQNQQGSFFVAQELGFKAERAGALASAFGMAPTHRTLIGASSGDLYAGILGQAALISRGWFDPEPEGSADAFRQMIEDAVVAGSRTSQIISDMVHRLQALF